MGEQTHPSFCRTQATIVVGRKNEAHAAEIVVRAADMPDFSWQGTFVSLVDPLMVLPPSRLVRQQS
jgi:hypothetical protein